MKRFLAFFLVAIMVMAVMPAFSAYAATGELLANGNLEEGDETGFVSYGACNMEVTEEAARKGSYGMSLTQRNNGYATWAYDVEDILTVNGPGEYTASLWIRLQDGQEPCTVHLTLITQETTASKPTYHTSAKKTLTTEWQQFVFKGKIEFDPKVGFSTALLYQQSEGGKGTPDIYIDDFSLVKNGEANGIPLDQVVKATPAPTKEPVSNTNTGSGKELLINPGFEEGDETGYINYGNCNMEVTEEAARKGEYGMSLTQRANGYATWAQDISDVLTLNGPGEYVASVWIRLQDGQEPCSVHLTMIVQANNADKATYHTSGRKKLTDEWQQFTFKGKLDFDPKAGFKTALIYQQSEGGQGAPDIYLDDFSLVKNGEVNGIPLDQVVKPDGSSGAPASGQELLENPGFEEGDETGFFAYGAGCNMEVTEEYFRTGEFGMLLEDRGSRYSTYAQDISEILTVNGPGEYLGSVWMKLAEDSKVGGKAMLVINVKTKAGVQRYYTSAEKQLTNEWQQFAFKGNIDFDPKKGFEVAYIYQQTETTPDILIDDFSLKKLSAVNGIPLDQVEKDEYEDFKMSSINVFTEEREEETTIGAIRWDAWYTHDGRPESIVTQVENTLSLPEYHWRAPFFAKITDEGKIQMPEYTQEIFDKEMEYAKEAGIDYFSYLWYSGNMGMARKLHATSKYKNDVKFTICLDGNGIGKSECREEVKALLKEDFYMTVLNGRPLMYYYVNTSNKKDNMALCASEMKYYRAYCEAEGIPAPFVVLMNITGTEVQTLYGDAVSRYSFSGTSDMTFNDFITKVQSNWETFQKTGSQYVPYLTFGWHAEPRYKTPVTWMKVEENSWVPYPTEEELYNHIAYALSYMDHPSAKDFTKANTLILYAWNEHDEGSWLCPTLKTDEKGNQLYNDDGTPMIDDSRVKAVRKAIDDFKNGKRVEVFINGVSNLAGGATNTENPSGNGNGFGLWWIIPVAIVVVVGGAAAAVIILKKKKTEEK